MCVLEVPPPREKILLREHPSVNNVVTLRRQGRQNRKAEQILSSLEEIKKLLREVHMASVGMGMVEELCKSSIEVDLSSGAEEQR